MQILGNPSQVVFHTNLDYSQHSQQRAPSRPSSLHPNLISDGNTHDVPQGRHHHEPNIHIPKKVSFHYSNNTEKQQPVFAPTKYPHHIQIQEEYRQNRKMSDYSGASNDMNNPSVRYRIKSTDQRSNASKESGRQVLKPSEIYINSANPYQLNYPPTIIKREQKTMQINHDFPRQRSRSSISSTCSTKIIVETVRQVNHDGSKGDPIEIKHRIETEYLTNLQNQGRQNYIMNGENLPKHIIVNHNYHSPNEARTFYSPHSNAGSRAPIQNSFGNTNLIVNNQNIQQSNQSTAEKAKFSEVFSYPVRSSDHEHLTKNNHQYLMRNQVNTQTSGQYRPVNEQFREFPITSESKFADGSRKDQFMKSQKFKQEEKQWDQNRKMQGAFQNQYSNHVHLHGNQAIYRGYGADIKKEVGVQNLIDRPAYKERNGKKYVITSEFYSISQKLIDEIFRNQTEKAVLKLKNLQRSSPRKYFSPQIRSHRPNRSTQKKAAYVREARQLIANSNNLHNQNMTSEETVKV